MKDEEGRRQEAGGRDHRLRSLPDLDYDRHPHSPALELACQRGASVRWVQVSRSQVLGAKRLILTHKWR